MKKIAFLIIIITSFVSCSSDDDTTAADNNPCGFEDLGITEAAKYPLTPESTTDVWNWKITNDTLKIQTSHYINYYEVWVQTYYFKITDNCIKPLFAKQYYGDDTMYEEYRKADFEATIEEFNITENLKFRVTNFSNVYINDQPYVNPTSPDFIPYFFTSPNGNVDIWVMFDNPQGATNYYDGYGF